MTTTTLYNKYRPKTFKQVVGHTDIVKSLKKTVKAGRAHAFLFTGPAGTGKTTLARILANEFCGGNASLTNIEEIPAAQYTGVDDMRAIAAKARTRAIGENGNRIFILDEAHRLSSQAWDSILKLIEEPPSHVYFMFCTTNEGKVPKTIQTRCQRIDLKPLTEDDLLKVLKRAVKGEDVDVPEEVLEVVAESASGSARQALSYLESCLYCETAAEARRVTATAGQTKEVVDLCRYLLQKRGRDWKSAMKILEDLKGTDAESIRIVVCNYMAAVAMKAKSGKEAAFILSIIECFSEPYNQSDKFAPLLVSIGEAIEVG